MAVLFESRVEPNDFQQPTGKRPVPTQGLVGLAEHEQDRRGYGADINSKATRSHQHLPYQILFRLYSGELDLAVGLLLSALASFGGASMR